MLVGISRSISGNRESWDTSFKFARGIPVRFQGITLSRSRTLPRCWNRGGFLSRGGLPFKTYLPEPGPDVRIRPSCCHRLPAGRQYSPGKNRLGDVLARLLGWQENGSGVRGFAGSLLWVLMALVLLLVFVGLAPAAVGGEKGTGRFAEELSGVTFASGLFSGSSGMVPSSVEVGPSAGEANGAAVAEETQEKSTSAEGPSSMDSPGGNSEGEDRQLPPQPQGEGENREQNPEEIRSGNSSSARSDSTDKRQSEGGLGERPGVPSSLVGKDGAGPKGEQEPPAEIPVDKASPPSLGAGKAETSPQRPYLLRYRFQPGEEVRWEILQQARVKTTVGGTTQVAESVTQSVKLWRVRECTPEGTVTFEHLVESVEMWQRLTGREEVRYSSRSPGDPPRGFEAIAASLNVPLATVTMDARGRILKRVRHPVKTLVDTEPLMTILLPEEPVSPGASWSFPYELEIPLENGMMKVVKAAEIYKLREVRSGVAIIEITTKVLTPINDPRLEAKLVQREREGVAHFDIEAGRLIRQEHELDRRVTGFSGQASLLQYSSRLTESFLNSRSDTARLPAASPPAR